MILNQNHNSKKLFHDFIIIWFRIVWFQILPTLTGRNYRPRRPCLAGERSPPGGRGAKRAVV